jgi:hypothetical protein
VADDTSGEPDEPHSPAGETAPGDPAPFPGWFSPLALAALIGAIVLVGAFAAKTSVASAVTSALAALAGLATTLLGLFKVRFAGLPPITRTATQVVVIVFVAMELGVSAGWAGWWYYRANRDIDVLSKITLAANRDVRPGGGPAALDVPVGARRDGIVLVFRIADHNTDIGNCVPYTKLVVTPGSGGNSGAPVQASPGGPVRVDVPPGTTKLHLDIAVTNIRNDRNCGVDLTVTSAKLRNH